MTLSATNPRISYVESAALTYAVPFRFLNSGDLIVTRRIGAAPPVTVVATTSGVGNPAGGSVTIASSVPGATLTIARRTPRTQPTLYTPGGPFPAKSHELALDRQMMALQEVDLGVGDVAVLEADVRARAVMVAPGVPMPPPFPTTVGQFLKFLGTTATGALAWIDRAVLKGDKGDQGNPGVNGGVGSLSGFAALFAAGGGMVVAAGVKMVRFAGGSVAGRAFDTVYDPVVNAAFVAAHPGWSFLDADGRGHRLSEPYADLAWFGAVADNATDCYPAIVKALDYLNWAGLAKLCINGHYYCSRDVQLKQYVIIEGQSSGQQTPIQLSKIRWRASTAGFVFNRYNTIDGITFGDAGRADGSTIRGMVLQGGGGPANMFHSATWERCRITMQDCFCYGWAGYGRMTRATGGVGGNLEGNANGWVGRTNAFVGNASGGHLVFGTDVNAGGSTHTDASQNGGFGIEDQSYLGNPHHFIHMEFNTLGPWRATSENAHHEFFGYTEPGQPPAQSAVGTVSGGNQYAGVVGPGEHTRANGLDGGGLGSTHGFYHRKAIGNDVFLTTMGTEENQPTHYLWTGYGTTWRNKSIPDGGFVIDYANELRILTVSIPPDRVSYSYAPSNLLIAGHDGDVNTRSRRLATVGAAADLEGTLVLPGDTFPLHSPVLGGPERLIAVNYGVIGSGGAVAGSGIVGGVQMTALADLPANATLAAVIAHINADRAGERVARQRAA